MFCTNEKQLSFRRCALFFMALIFSGFAALLLFDVELLAKTDSRGMDRLFGIVGVIKVPPAEDPVRINLKDMNGNNISLSDFKGKIVFLNFWTTWCPTCRIEMPSMEKLHQKLKNEDFAMVTINLQESASQVKAFFKEFKLTFTALLDSTGEVGASFGIRAIPTTYILDKTGRIIGLVSGPREWDSKAAIALFENLIDNDVVAATSEAAN
ncbi:MAG: TlpA family protein disulfide reductase [Deltaproteobacteria bacterium]|nr:TlpA family protein disulfide reductase [Deltaproteobacteria bacterium]